MFRELTVGWRGVSTILGCVSQSGALCRSRPRSVGRRVELGRVITGLQHAGINVTAAPIPLTTLDDDVSAVIRAIDRTEGPVVLAGHAYAGGVIGAVSHPRIKALVYVVAWRPTKAKPSPTSSTGIPRTRKRQNSNPTATG